MSVVEGRVCSDCEHGYVGPEGLFCMTYREMIDDVRVAVECMAFDPIPASVITEFVARPGSQPVAVASWAGPQTSTSSSAFVSFNETIREVLDEAAPRFEGRLEVRAALLAQKTPALTVDEVVAAPPPAELLAACEAYLAIRHCVLWGEVFEVISPKGRADAAEWLAQQITAIGFVADDQKETE